MPAFFQVCLAAAQAGFHMSAILLEHAAEFPSLCNFPRSSVTRGTESAWLNHFSQVSLSSYSEITHFLGLHVCVCTEWGRQLCLVWPGCWRCSVEVLQPCWWSAAPGSVVWPLTVTFCFTTPSTTGFTMYFWQNLFSKLPGRWWWCALSSGGDPLVCAELLTGSLKKYLSVTLHCHV